MRLAQTLALSPHDLFRFRQPSSPPNVPNHHLPLPERGPFRIRTQDRGHHIPVTLFERNILNIPVLWRFSFSRSLPTRCRSVRCELRDIKIIVKDRPRGQRTALGGQVPVGIGRSSAESIADGGIGGRVVVLRSRRRERSADNCREEPCCRCGGRVNGVKGALKCLKENLPERDSWREAKAAQTAAIALQQREFWWCKDLKLSFLRLWSSAVDEKGRDALG